MQEILTQLFGELVTDDVLKQFNAELGKKFVSKTDYNARLEEIKTLKTDKQSLEENITKLTENSKNAEDFKEKFENLQKEIREKEEQAEADRKAKEKADNISSRFDAALGDRKFTHEAVKADYLRKFGEALENKDFQGKADADVLHELTKDDAAAFQGVTAFRLQGGSAQNFGGEHSDLGKLDMAEYIAARKKMKG